jgi:hypothetical protein
MRPSSILVRLLPILLFLPAISADAQVFNPSKYAGTWQGSWKNLTFSSTGAASLVITVKPADSTMVLKLDLDGFVGGLSNPDPWFATAKYDAAGMRLDSVATAGTLSLRWKGNDSIAWTFTNMTTPGFSSQTGKGKSFTDSIGVDYTVFFSVSGSAIGVTNFRKVSSTAVHDPTMGLPAGYALAANYPNPFNPNTHIMFRIPMDEQVRISVHSVSGEEVSTIIDSRVAAGEHEVQFDGSGLASGVYYYRMTTAAATVARKMLLLK